MRVSVVNGICIASDAISESVRGSVVAIREMLGAETRLFTYANDFAEIDATIVRNVADVLLDKFFLSSDVVLYHFGVYYELFNAITLGNNHARQIVYYHNITPKEFSPSNQITLVERSLRQRANIDSADAVLVASSYSKSDLVAFGVSPSKISICPLYLKFENSAEQQLARSPGRIEILYVGRFVRSKGVLDLIDAAAGLQQSGVSFRLRLAGNVQFSDATYLKALLEKVTALGLDNDIVFMGQVSDTELQSLYEAADIFVMPSYHEGFCVPIVEALAAGCVPLAYASGSVPELVGGRGKLVEAGDTQMLTAALIDLARQFARGGATFDFGDGPIDRAFYWASVQEFLKQFVFDSFAQKMARTVREMACK